MTRFGFIEISIVECDCWSCCLSSSAIELPSIIILSFCNLQAATFKLLWQHSRASCRTYRRRLDYSKSRQRTLSSIFGNVTRSFSIGVHGTINVCRGSEISLLLHQRFVLEEDGFEVTSVILRFSTISAIFL